MIFLFGHRKQHGKDTCCDILEKILEYRNITYTRTYFAKKLKKHCSERYDLDFYSMDDEDYKKSKPAHLGGLTVRDVLIKEGTLARSIWQDVWSSATYKEILDENRDIGIISDFRYPNEYKSFYKIFNRFEDNCGVKRKNPIIIKVLVNRPKGKYVSDGADDQLPDLYKEGEEFVWDWVINNNIEDANWYNNLESQIESLVINHIGVGKSDLSIHQAQ